MTEISGSHRSEPLPKENVDAPKIPTPEEVLRDRFAEALMGIVMYKYKHQYTKEGVSLDSLRSVMKRAGLTDEILESMLSELERTYTKPAIAKPSIEKTEEL